MPVVSDRLDRLSHRDIRCRDARRGWVERVLRLSRHLPPRDRVLLEQVYRYGLPLSDVAVMVGRDRHWVQRRVGHLLRRLRDPMFGFLIRARGVLPRDTHEAARLIIHEGQSRQRVARRTGQSLHTVRHHLHTARTLCRFQSFSHRKAQETQGPLM